MGKAMMQLAEKYKLIPEEQYGGRQEKSAVHQVMNLRLLSDYQRARHAPYAVCANDAKSCFDRMVHSVATLCMRRLGLNHVPIHSMMTTIQNMYHHVKTAFGISEDRVGSPEWELPIAGCGQGNGCGPHQWLAIAIIVTLLSKEYGFGISITDPLIQEVMELLGVTFIDDHTSFQDGETPEVIVENTNRALEAWRAGIHASGGAINPQKTSWFMVGNGPFVTEA